MLWKSFKRTSKHYTFNQSAKYAHITLCTDNKHSELNVKVLVYETSSKPLIDYLRYPTAGGTTKVSNANEIQHFQNIAFKKITNAPPFSVQLHEDLSTGTVSNEAAPHFYTSMIVSDLTINRYLRASAIIEPYLRASTSVVLKGILVPWIVTRITKTKLSRALDKICC